MGGDCMATISKVEIDTKRLQKDIDILNSNLSRMRKTGSNMMHSINALNAMWEGETKNAFLTQFKSDYETLESMEKVIEELIDDLEYAKNKYNSCENQVASIINSIRI